MCYVMLALVKFYRCYKLVQKMGPKFSCFIGTRDTVIRWIQEYSNPQIVSS